MNSIDEKNKELYVEGPDPEKIACRKCKWTINGAMKCNCLKYSFKPKDVYYHGAECPMFEALRKLTKK